MNINQATQLLGINAHVTSSYASVCYQRKLVSFLDGSKASNEMRSILTSAFEVLTSIPDRTVRVCSHESQQNVDQKLYAALDVAFKLPSVSITRIGLNLMVAGDLKPYSQSLASVGFSKCPIANIWVFRPYSGEVVNPFSFLNVLLRRLFSSDLVVLS